MNFLRCVTKIRGKTETILLFFCIETSMFTSDTNGLKGSADEMVIQAESSHGRSTTFYFVCICCILTNI
jgi:hypothetical protein